MDLFVVNRYLGEDKVRGNKNDAGLHLSKFLEKVQERKKRKESLEVISTKNENLDKIENLSHEPKKAITNSEKPTRKRSKNKIEKPTNISVNQINSEIQAVDDSNNVGLKRVRGKRRHRKAELTPTINGFTVIGADLFQKRNKVKRVLPNWLANPCVVTGNLKELTNPVESIPELDKYLIKLLKDNSITHFFPVQSKVIPWLLKDQNIGSIAHYWSSDVCVSAPTGSGKTLTFVLPVIQALKNRVVPRVRALILLPSQDLAQQVFDVFSKYCSGTDLKVALTTGRNSFEKEQQQLVRANVLHGWQSLVDIVVTTPGRLVDHLKFTPGFSLEHLKFLVIDEADRVLDNIQNNWLHFVEKHINGEMRQLSPSITTLNNFPRPPLKLLFSATLSQDPEKLQQLSLFQPKLFTSVVFPEASMLNQGQELRGDFVGKFTTPANLEEQLCVASAAKKPMVLHHLLACNNWEHVLCFTNSQEAAHRLVVLMKHFSGGQLKIAEISSTFKLQDRTRILTKFRAGEVRVLVGTDSVARGIDIPDIDLVVLYELPKYIKTYIHRVGRTCRAGRPGTAITLLLPHQLSHFHKMLQAADKKQGKVLVVSDKDLAPLEQEYNKALQALAQELSHENTLLYRKSSRMKRKTVGAKGPLVKVKK